MSTEQSQNHKNFRPVWRVTFCKKKMIFQYSYMVTNFKACVRYYLVLHQMIVLQKLWKMFFMTYKNPFCSRVIQIFVIFSLSTLPRFKSAGESGIISFFLYQGILSRTVTTHRIAGEGIGPFLFHTTTSTLSRLFRYLQLCM